VSTLRSLAFGAAVVLATTFLLLGNVSVWAFSSVLDPPALSRVAIASLRRPEVRRHVSTQLAAQLAPAVLALGPLPPDLRRVLDLPARPSEERLGAVLQRQVDAALADPASDTALRVAATAVGDAVTDLLDRSPGASGDGADALLVDLRDLVRLVLERSDPSGTLARALPPDVGTLRLVDDELVRTVAPVARLVDSLRWALPVVCAVVILALLVLARYRVHALAWVGLAAVIAGTLSLLAASGVPVLMPRLLGADEASTVAVTAALDGITASLVTQSAVLAGLGLALVVVGIAGGIVVSQEDRGADGYHGWDSGRLS
jgi:hypothetical protein